MEGNQATDVHSGDGNDMIFFQFVSLILIALVVFIGFLFLSVFFSDVARSKSYREEKKWHP